MKSIVALSAALMIAVSVSTYAAHDDPEAGKQKATVCAAGHGADSKGVVPTFPNPAGQVPGYIAKQLAMFKAEERVDASMRPMVATLTPGDMHNLYAYFYRHVATPRLN